MSDEVKVPQRTIVINGYEDHIEVKTEGYQHYLMIIFELQNAIGLVTQQVQEKSKIVVPNIVAPRMSQ